ncbi:MAG: fluoride efflux transporter CrcB [Pseudomonadota bacterium]|jgi:CrcB protein
MLSILPVMAGGALGAALRYLVGRALPPVGVSGFPVATLCVNLIGGFAMGMLAAWLTRGGGGEGWRLFLGVGLLGGFTTFSAFSLDAMVMIDRGAWGLFASYALLSVLGSVAALAFGMMIVRGSAA